MSQPTVQLIHRATAELGEPEPVQHDCDKCGLPNSICWEFLTDDDSIHLCAECALFEERSK